MYPIDSKSSSSLQADSLSLSSHCDLLKQFLTLPENKGVENTVVLSEFQRLPQELQRKIWRALKGSDGKGRYGIRTVEGIENLKKLFLKMSGSMPPSDPLDGGADENSLSTSPWSGPDAYLSDAYWLYEEKRLKELLDPVERFNAFDALLEGALDAPPFLVLKSWAQDPTHSWSATSRLDPRSYLGSLGPQYISSILAIVERSLQLSEATIQPLQEKSRLWSVCRDPETYVHTRLYQALAQILFSKNFISRGSKAEDVLYPLNQKVWELINFNHGSFCSCHERMHRKLRTDPSIQWV